MLLSKRMTDYAIEDDKMTDNTIVNQWASEVTKLEAENEALRERNKIMSDLLVEIYDMIELRIPKHAALLTGVE